MWEFLKGIWNDFIYALTQNGWKILFVLSLLIVGYFVIKGIAFVFRKILYKTRIDDAVVIFYSSILKIILWVGVILAAASVLDISTNSLLVALSSIALAVGLALKDSLSNLANGIIIIFNKPFKRGDHVSIDGVEGKVLNIRLLTTELICFDNKKIVLPNSKAVNGAVTNYTALPTRRIDKIFTVSYDSDLVLVKKTIMETIEKMEKVHKTPAPSVFMSAQSDSSLDYTVRVWVNTEDFWIVSNSITELMFNSFTEAGINVPFPQMDVHLFNEEK